MRSRISGWIIAWRYPILLAWSLGWFGAKYETESRGLSDWLWFEFGARTLIHLNSHFATGSLHLYAHYPVVQIGPPPLVVVASLQWLSPATVALVLGLVMTVASVSCLRSAEVIARNTIGVEHRRRISLAVMSAGLVSTPIWAWQVARWQHLDDVMAVTLLLAAMALIARRKWWGLAAVMVGIAIASKPWALVMAPILMVLPRQHRAYAALIALGSAAAPWLPFVIADRSTLSALAGFHFTVDPLAAVHSLGMPLGVAPSWARPLQLVGGCTLALLVARRGRWEAIPILALGFRVVSDPQSWSYYGMAPLMGAVVMDLVAARRVPVWTASTALVEFAVRAILPGWTGPVQLAWFAVVLVTVLRRSPDAPLEMPADTTLNELATARG